MPDDQQQDPLKALENLIAKRKSAVSPSIKTAVAEPTVQPIDTEAMLAKAKARDEVNLQKQRQELEKLRQSSPQSQAIRQQKQVDKVEEAQADEFADAYEIHQINHSSIPVEDEI